MPTPFLVDPETCLHGKRTAIPGYIHGSHASVTNYPAQIVCLECGKTATIREE